MLKEMVRQWKEEIKKMESGKGEERDRPFVRLGVSGDGA
jgi:hypothetical protein